MHGAVTRCHDIRITGAGTRVHHDPVAALESAFLGQFHVWHDPDSGDDNVGFKRPAVAGFDQERSVVAADGLHRLLQQQFNTAFPVQLRVELGHDRGEGPRHQAFHRFDDDHRLTQGPSNGCYFKANESATDDGDAPRRR